MRRLPPLGSIQAFVGVARLGSFKAAADALALSSPALTRRIQALEQFMGTPLFERQRNGVQMNAQGEKFLGEIEPLIEALALAVERASEPAKGTRLRIAVPSLFASQRLLPALPSFRKAHPNLQIDVDTGSNRLSRLSDGIDAAIAITDRIDPSLYARVLEKGRIVAVGSRSYAEGAGAITSAADLGRAPILLHRDLPNAFHEWCKAAGMPHMEPASVDYFDSGQLMIDAAANGLGVAFMFESHLSGSSDARLTQLFSQAMESPLSYWFACSPTALTRRPVKLFHDWLFDHFSVAASPG